jgi:hypothetical protein
MAEIQIQIVDSKLQEMEIEQEPTYATLYFAEHLFAAYWRCSDLKTITFYVGGTSYLCRNTPKNVEIFDNIINGKAT